MIGVEVAVGGELEAFFNIGRCVWSSTLQEATVFYDNYFTTRTFKNPICSCMWRRHVRRRGLTLKSAAVLQRTSIDTVILRRIVARWIDVCLCDLVFSHSSQGVALHRPSMVLFFSYKVNLICYSLHKIFANSFFSQPRFFLHWQKWTESWWNFSPTGNSFSKNQLVYYYHYMLFFHWF